jgi:hypothetical protein
MFWWQNLKREKAQAFATSFSNAADASNDFGWRRNESNDEAAGEGSLLTNSLN